MSTIFRPLSQALHIFISGRFKDRIQSNSFLPERWEGFAPFFLTGYGHLHSLLDFSESCSNSLTLPFGTTAGKMGS